MSSQMAWERHANWQKNSSKVRDKWQRKVRGMPIYAAFGSQLFLLPRIYVPYGNIVFHGIELRDHLGKKEINFPDTELHIVQ
jgi:hypothetical protein